jgi:hypothetical protein
MTEYPRAIHDGDGLHWADGGSPETITEPDEGLKEAGYAALAKPAAAHWNWREREIGRLAEWTAGVAVRRFSTLADGIAATEPGELFQVHDANGRRIANLEQGAPDDWLAITVGTPTCWCQDGLRAYCGYADGSVVAYSLADGSTAWTEQTTNDEACVQMCCDGARLFVAAFDGATGIRVNMMDASDGSIIDTDLMGEWSLYHCPNGCGMAANGTYMVMAGSSSTATGVLQYSYTPTEIVDKASYTHGTVAGTMWIRCVAIHDTWFVAAGNVNASDRFIVKVSLLTNTVIGSLTNAAWSPTPIFNSISTDGLRIYATGTQGDYDTTGTHRQFEFSSYIEGVIFPIKTDTPSYDADIDGASCWTPKLHVINDSDAGILIFNEDFYSLGWINVQSEISVSPSSFDGRNLWIRQAATTIRGYALSQEGIYRRASDLDIYRRAPGQLAQLVIGGI